MEKSKLKGDIVQRWEGNPIVTLDDLTFTTNNIYSAGAVKYDGKYILLVTAEDTMGKTAIYRAESSDGHHFEVEETPFLSAQTEGPLRDLESVGVREARITQMAGRFYFIYSAVGKYDYLLCLGVTDDFKKSERLGVISLPENKGGALFPKKFDGKFVRLERPGSGGRIWISFSNEMLTWGESEVLISPRPGYWDSNSVGCAFPPIETPEGSRDSHHVIGNFEGGPRGMPSENA